MLIKPSMANMLLNRQRQNNILSGKTLLQQLKNVVINGIRVPEANQILYLGKDYDSTNGWAAEIGETLPLVSTGDAPTKAQDTGLRSPLDYSVTFPGGQVCQYGSSGYADITTEDVYATFLLITPADFASYRYVFYKSNYYCGIGANKKISIVLSGPGGYYITTYNTELVENTAYLCTFFYDASEATEANALQIYVNKLNNTAYAKSATNPSTIGSLTNAVNFTIGSTSVFASKFTGAVAYLQIAKLSNLFAGGAQNLTDWAAFHNAMYNLIAPNGL